ncbi:MFS general substrate transporter [Wallemia mellicola]|uniref:MFS general substrate transporter n=1 Tax=Wallemia mellicola TaxID=1708541 RepID=A0A4T0TKK9_9BASI|nr:MFS general substrate transporter [Wallemia mellicola]TIC61677.1 MFS general substrate transporter [Wallemia mellicola]TIC65460.1 MFS general substrate transporter [Wallemia mellicola]
MSGLKKSNIPTTIFPQDKTLEHVEHPVDNGRRASEPHLADEDDVDSREKKVIIVRFEDNDPENPENWSNIRKWVTTILLCLMTLFIGLATSAYSVGINDMTAEFGVSAEVGQVGMFVFNASFALVPLFLAPLSEYIGRNPIYLVNYACFVAFFFQLGFAQNIWTAIIGRFFSGCFGAAGTTMVGGTLSDIWRTHERAGPMSLFTWAAVFGTIAAPIYSGWIDLKLGWRWIEWIQLIANFTLLVLECFLLKETRGAVLLARRAKKMRQETGDDSFRAPSELEADSFKTLLHNSSTRALMLLVKEPVVLFFSIWISFAWGIIFLFFSCIPLTFQNNHGWNVGQQGFPYISLAFGTFLGFATNFLQDHLYQKATVKNGGVPVPEARLYGAQVGAILLPVGMFWYGWTLFPNIHYIVPIIALTPIILGIYHIFLAVYNYLADSYGEFSSSAVAAQGFMRNLFAASFPLFATYMFNGMGLQYACTMLAIIGCLCAPLPFILFFKGESIRARSQYASGQTGIAQKMETQTSDVEKQSRSSSN